MTRYRQNVDFVWYQGNPDTALAQTETDDVGMIHEIDVLYSQSLHDTHNNLSFLSFNRISSGSRISKLMVTFEKKEKFFGSFFRPN